MVEPAPLLMDPIKAAWSILLAFLVAVCLNTAMVFVACTSFHVQTMCERDLGLQNIFVEMLTAVAILLGASRK